MSVLLLSTQTLKHLNTKTHLVLQGNWWKYLAVGLLLYTILGGLLMDVPKRFILHESIRNLYFHVPMWFSMIFLFFISLFYSIKYLALPGNHPDISQKR